MYCGPSCVTATQIQCVITQWECDRNSNFDFQMVCAIHTPAFNNKGGHHILNKFTWQSTYNIEWLVIFTVNRQITSIVQLDHSTWTITCFNVHRRVIQSFFTSIKLEEKGHMLAGNYIAILHPHVQNIFTRQVSASLPPGGSYGCF